METELKVGASTIYITRSGHYYISQNSRYTGNACKAAIVIAANGVEIDFRGFEICNGTCAAVNAIFSENRSGITLRNGTFSGFNSTATETQYGAAVRFEGVTRFNFYSLSVKNCYRGFHLAGCNLGNLENINMTDINGAPLQNTEGACFSSDLNSVPPGASTCSFPSSPDNSNTNDFSVYIPPHGTGLYMENTHNVDVSNLKINNAIQGIHSIGCQNHYFNQVFMRGTSLVRGMTIPSGENHIYDNCQMKMGNGSAGFAHIGVGNGIGGESFPTTSSNNTYVDGIRILGGNFTAHQAYQDTSGFLLANAHNVHLEQNNIDHRYHFMIDTDAAAIRQSPGPGFLCRNLVLRENQVMGITASGIHFQANNLCAGLGNPLADRNKVSLTQFTSGVRISGFSATSTPGFNLGLQTNAPSLTTNLNASNSANLVPSGSPSVTQSGTGLGYVPSFSAPILTGNYIAGISIPQGNATPNSSGIGILVHNSISAQIINNSITNVGIGIVGTGVSGIGLYSNVFLGTPQVTYLEPTSSFTYNVGNVQPLAITLS